MDNKEKTQEMYMEYQLLGQQIKQAQQQLEGLTGQLVELDSTKSSLYEFEKVKPDKEIFVPISSGIFAKAQIKDTKELLVNVGSNVVVSKDISQAKKLIEKQIVELKGIQKRMIENLEKMMDNAAQMEASLKAVMKESK
jgi:prefoldin alpha subunit